MWQGKTVQQIGWKAVYEYEEEQEEDLAEGATLYRKWIKEKDLRSKEQRLRKERRSRLQDLRGSAFGVYGKRRSRNGSHKGRYY